jgi:glycosyltransferase involved in cell wall biosynthesis
VLFLLDAERNSRVERSLTVLLPVHNAQSTLSDTVVEILEVVSDLTDRFELVIVDDGSVDATSEVAQELTCRYPQVRAVRHGQCLGCEAAVRTGLQRSSGEIVFVRDESGGPAIDGIPQLWRAAKQPELVFNDSASPSKRKWSRFSPGHAVRRAGYQMIDRPTLERMHGLGQPTRPNYLTRMKDFALEE